MILTITTELINGYSVDGLMLDYIRTTGFVFRGIVFCHIKILLEDH